MPARRCRRSAWLEVTPGGNRVQGICLRIADGALPSAWGFSSTRAMKRINVSAGRASLPSGPACVTFVLDPDGNNIEAVFH
jgi:hypothetical protein